MGILKSTLVNSKNALICEAGFPLISQFRFSIQKSVVVLNIFFLYNFFYFYGLVKLTLFLKVPCLMELDLEMRSYVKVV